MRIVREQETHGMHRSKEYKSWAGMIDRCTNPKSTAYRNYGMRGITVCSRWRNSFISFYEDMGDRPKGATLDRINNEGNYEPSNCRWATWSIQAVNKRLRKDNITRVVGVAWRRKNNAYHVRIQREGESHFLGQTPDFFEAICLRKSAENSFVKWKSLNDALPVIEKRKRLSKRLGVDGVYWNARERRYKASIRRDGMRKSLGTTMDFFEACCLRKSAEAAYLRGR